MAPAVTWPAGRLVLLLTSLTPGLRAQSAVGSEPPPIEFFGFRPGATLSDVALRVKHLGGRLTCARAKADVTVSECRAGLRDPASQRQVVLWASAIDGVTGILTLSGPVTGQQLDSWRTALERPYGHVDAVVQGPQWMMQWVRRGRMIRLTWRIMATDKVASVSLVDGRVLDDWGRRRAASEQDSLP